MVISFDLDNLLIPFSDEFEVERKPRILEVLGFENLRKGTKELFSKLKNQGHEIWIYTTSYRSIFQIKITFGLYGLFPSKFINEEINRKKLKANNCNASKNPKLFGIDIHIDDSEGVRMEGERYNFKTIIIDPNCINWVSKILDTINTERLT